MDKLTITFTAILTLVTSIKQILNQISIHQQILLVNCEGLRINISDVRPQKCKHVLIDAESMLN